MGAPVWIGLGLAQADGQACVVCGRNFRIRRSVSVPVGRSRTGSQVFACVGRCAEAAAETGQPDNVPADPMSGPEHVGCGAEPAAPETCPDCGREGTGTPIPGSPGEVECQVCSASWEPDERPHAGGQQLPAWQADRLTALLDALGDIPISAAERLSLTWLAGFEVGTVERIAAAIRRARDRSAVIAARRHDPELQRLRRALDAADDEVVSRHREADRYRGQLLDLCEWAGIDPGQDPHAALLAHLRGREPLAGELADAVAGFLAAWDSADASWRSLDAPVITMRRAHKGRRSS